MSRITVRPQELVPGYYVAFGSTLDTVAFFCIKNYPEGLVIWGLSRYRGSIAYRTLGIPLNKWLEKQNAGTQFRKDKNRTGWKL
jgi:hypothetical protein